MQDEAPPGPPPEWAKGEKWKDDPNARAEKSTWPDPEALQGTKDENTLRLLRHSGTIAVCLMWFFALVFVLSMAVWLLHFLTTWGWLNELQLSKIQTVVFSGSLGALVSAFAQKHIGQ
ncbi:hypothetical protein GTA62_21560 [Roseobacter sp. HKCCD9010]|uniref:hypothetical protein n=1 Tax=unclassified Roseobacter TaxID=196798 RepID=UPI001492D1FA|nr:MULTISPECIES: hypothetical protein [unclassified Roseobacter]MBF9052339.1 hypothetical protein [Rhodobacterales bacterium HKCCD4356]NNV14489.1 hypothetical protein [Roseobacter sp. HKCCD7357]NNV18772.1 hypothetical protein [Roseobacter sp. HKCCD8768]NNV28199.1 hypothetical protein [Roseobacter sp. HKCCD8192]NNV32483.1 hypothetical protein [Roseobacter sp. HKCCD9061]